ncbi:MAG: hypothetical protein UFS73_05620 [Weissella confusa]|nr:hypothetical protein [Weissella confusa]
MASFKKADKYVVLVDFTDFKNDNKKYKAGDEYPASATVTRLKELLADDNEGRTDGLIGAPIIEAVEVEQETDDQKQDEGTVDEEGESED